jgi:hypothetical protein
MNWVVSEWSEDGTTTRDNRSRPQLSGRRGPGFVREGLLDEIVIHLAPVLLGDGTRLFTAPGGKLSPSGARRWPRLGRSPTCGSAS